jgi:SepF-like predicted cell division protein (DUF552 family)
VRFLFRRKEDKKEPAEEIVEERGYKGLGVFSPVVENLDTGPIKDYRKMAELDSIFIRSRRLDSLDDVSFIVNQVREGNIVLLDITKLNDGKEQTHLELKRIIERIRGETRGIQAELALVNEQCMIVTPSFVKM